MASTVQNKNNINVMTTQEIVEHLIRRSCSMLWEVIKRNAAFLWCSLAVAELTYIIVKQVF